MSKQPTKGKTLAEVNPQLAKEWHPTKNGSLSPEVVSPNDKRQVWWKCPQGDDHEWKASIQKRHLSKSGCHVCWGRKVVASNCLENNYPEIANQWHPTKNGELTPKDVTSKSTKRVWWKCPVGDDHEWEAPITNRTSKKNGCLICSGHKVVLSNCLKTNYPEIAKEWHPNKNEELTPYNVSHTSSKKVWWQCPKGDDHEYESTVGDRTNRKRGCSVCSGKKVVLSNCLATTHPELAKEWHLTKNGNLSPYDLTKGSTKIKIWWKCLEGDDHEWEAMIANRTNIHTQSGCPICTGYKIVKSNCLATTHPELAKEFHFTKNGKLTPYNVGGGHTKVWWQCAQYKDHVYQASLSHRIRNNSSCPYCFGEKVAISNSLAITHPHIAKEWHPTKNGKLTPYEYKIGSNKNVWWKCSKAPDHEWNGNRKRINAQGVNQGCPFCAGQKVTLSNCLATTHPELAKEWHPTKNGNLTPSDFTIGSDSTKIWWQCDKGVDHIWKTTINGRDRGKRGCPFCTLTPQSKQELSITFELKLFFDINPKGFKTRINEKLLSIDIYISTINLGIEFDGSYWHKGKRELDKIKTEKLLNVGFSIMRIREEPLKPIFTNDIISTLPFDAKKVTNNILKHILNNYKIASDVSKEMINYLNKKELQNEKRLNKYIDEILEEKAQKKKTHYNKT
jgi:hypothetical protein